MKLKKLIITLLLSTIVNVNFAQIIFYEDFEITNTNTWTFSSTNGQRGLTTNDFVTENHSFIICNQNGLYDGIYHSFQTTIFPNYISFYIKTDKNAGGNLVLTDSNNAPIIYFKADSTHNEIGIQGRNNFYGIAYNNNKWHFIEIKDINYSNKTFSLHINNQHIADSIIMINNSYISKIHLSNSLSTATAKWDNVFLGNRGALYNCSTPLVNNKSVCMGDSAYLTTNNCKDILWWNDANQGNMICNNDSIFINNINSNLSFYAENQCYLNNLDLHSAYNGNKATNAVIFELYPDIDINLEGIFVNANAQNKVVSIYYKEGISNGFQNSLSCWTLIKTDTINAIYGDKSHIDFNQISLKKDKIYSICILNNDTILYTNNLTRNRSINDGNIIVKTTYIGDVQLSNMQNTAIFNGGIRYDIAAEKKDSIIENHYGNYISTYNAKGMCFVAPCDMVITAVRTPGALSNQIVEIVKFNDGLPPFNPNITNKFSSEFFTEVNHNNFINCKVNLRAGEAVAIFGKSNDISSMGDSSRHTKYFNGLATTIYCCRTDDTLNSNNQLQNLYRTYTGNCCKMDIEYILPSKEFTSNRSEVQINVNQLPNIDMPNDTTVCNSNTSISINAFPLGGIYSGNYLSLFNVFHPNIAGVGQHKVYYTYTDSNQCVNTDSTKINVIICSSLNENNNENIKIYPNPAKNIINIEFAENTKQNFKINIYNQQSQIVKSKAVIIENKLSNIDVSDLENGTYILVVESVEKRYSFKVVVY